MKVVKVKISDLKPAEYNPRQASKKQWEGLKKSLEEFGFIDPIIVNSAKSRKNVIIGGHFRWQVARELGYKEIPVIYIKIDNIKRERELNLRLNRNLGSWDIGMLLSFDEDMLKDVGWSAEELERMISFDKGKEISIKDLPSEEDIRLNKCPKCGYEW